MKSQAASWLWRRLGALQWPILWLVSPKYCIGVNALIVNDDGAIWLQQHRYWPGQAWGLPGGLVESNELPEDALKREIGEEIGRSATILRPLASQLPYRRGLTLCYLAEMGDEPLQLDGNEILQAGFYRPSELPEPLLPAHRQLIYDALDAYTNSGGMHEYKD